MATTSKAMVWTGRVISALLVAFMLMGVTYAFVKPAMVSEGMAKYGYPDRYAMRLVYVELACVILYAIPQTAVLGAILLTGYLGGATATHVRAAEAFYFPVIMGVLVWLGLYLRDSRIRTLIPLRSER
jgi:hypothetical protein